MRRRRDVLRGVGVTGALALAGCSGSDAETTTSGDADDGEADAGDGGDDGTAADAGGGGCTPGHTEGDPVCQQIADDIEALTPFDAAGTALPVTFEYPCGWETSTTDAIQDWFQVNAVREGIGDDDAGSAHVQIQAVYEPVESGYIEETWDTAQFDEVEYEYDGETRTGLLNTAAPYSAVGHVVVPFDGSLVLLRFVANVSAETCDADPTPDKDLVRAVIRSLGPNPNTTFSTA